MYFHLVQACDIEDDGLFSFDVHSDGDGRRYLESHSISWPLNIHLLVFSLKNQHKRFSVFADI